jgi:5'-nucleotidase
MRILVTNDDGIDSLGLHVLARAMVDIGEVVVVAPDTEYSGASAALGALHTIRPDVHRAIIDGVAEAWAVEGPPALCVMFANLGAFGPPFDLVVSGINPGANVGRSVYHSGTIGATLTARNAGVSGVAVSQAVPDAGVEGQGDGDDLEGQRWDSAATVAAALVDGLLGQSPTAAVAINLNVPNLPVDEMTGWRRTTVGVAPERAMAGVTLESKPGHTDSYRTRMAWGPQVSLPPETDGGAVQRGFVSVTTLGSIPADHGSEPAMVGVALDKLLGSELS